MLSRLTIRAKLVAAAAAAVLLMALVGLVARSSQAALAGTIERLHSRSLPALQARSGIDENVTGISKVFDVVSEITGSAREPSAGIDQVNGAVGELAKVAQQDAPRRAAAPRRARLAPPAEARFPMDDQSELRDFQAPGGPHA